MTRKNYFYCTHQLTGIAFDCFRLHLDLGFTECADVSWKLGDADTKVVTAFGMHSEAKGGAGRIGAHRTNKIKLETTWEVSLCARCYSRPFLALWRPSP